MATKDCLEFISSQQLAGIADNVKWKRVSKHKDSDKNEIRVFESPSLDKVTVKEDVKTGAFSILEFLPAPNLSVLNVLFQEKTDLKQKFSENFNLLAEITFLVEALHSQKYFPEDEHRHNNPQFKKEKIEELKQDYIAEWEDAKDSEKISKICDAFFHDLATQQREQPNKNSFLSEPLKVFFDFENLEVEIKHLPADINKQFDVLVCYGGGDWEIGVHFAVFWDNKANCPCMYVPSEKFNVYNRKFMTAYGSEQDNLLGLEMTEKDEDEKEGMLENENYVKRDKEVLISLQNYLAKKLSNSPIVEIDNSQRSTRKPS